MRFCSLPSVLCGYPDYSLSVTSKSCEKDTQGFVVTDAYSHLEWLHTHIQVQKLLNTPALDKKLEHECSHTCIHVCTDESITQALNSQVTASENSLPSLMAQQSWHNKCTLKSLYSLHLTVACICALERDLKRWGGGGGGGKGRMRESLHSCLYQGC